MKNGRFYNEGNKQGSIYLYSEGQSKQMAERIYKDFCSQADFDEDGNFNTDKASFISGWIDAMMG